MPDLAFVVNRPLTNITTPVLQDQPQTSTKQWTTQYHNLEGWTVMPNTLQHFERQDNFGPLDDADDHRLDDIEYALHEFPKVAALEDEVRAAFHMFVEHPIQYAWFRRGVYVRNGIGPPGAALIPGEGSMTVDFMAQSGDSALAIGEYKRPGVNILTEWRRQKPPSNATLKLGRELRGYAHQYNCHQVFCYDAKSLLALRFECNSRNEIRTCQPKCWVIETASGNPNVTVRRMIYSLVRDGYQRVQGQRAGDHLRMVSQHQLLRRYFSRQILWRSQNGQMFWDHPTLTKTLDEDNRRWTWEDDDEAVVHAEVGAI